MSLIDQKKVKEAARRRQIPLKLLAQVMPRVIWLDKRWKSAGDTCFITHYESPSKFWIMLKSDMSDFLAISEEFKKLLLEIPKGQVKRVKAGDLYCLIDEDFWARVKVVTVGHGGNLTVFFPDDGKQGAIHISQLFHLEETMRSFPAQAMCCCIGNAKPKGRTWNEMAQSAVEKWLGEAYSKEMSFEVLEKRGNTHALEIINGEGENLAEFLICQGLAEASDTSANLPKLTNKKADVNGTEHVPGTTRFMAKDLKGQADYLKEGDRIFISNLEFTQLSQFMGLVISSNTKEVLHQIESILKDLNLDEGTPYCPVQGELVLAKFSGDNCWYRSGVSRVDGDEFKVLFLDYGNAEPVKAKNIRKIGDRRLTTFPVLAAAFQLWGVDPNIDMDNKSAQDYFGELLLEFGPEEGKWSVVVKSKEGSSIVVDFISSTKKETFSELFYKRLSAKGASPVPKEKGDCAATVCLPCETLPNDINCQVCVFFVESCSSFYVGHEAKQETLQSLMVRINEDVKSLPRCDDPVTGNLVVTDYSGLWYRAQIKSVMRNEKKCKVFYLDYGNCADVAMENLYQLPEWATSEPAFAIHCSLDVDSVKLSPDAESIFKSVEEKIFTVSVLRKEEAGDKSVVKMYADDNLDILELMTHDLENEKKSSPSKSLPSPTPSRAAQGISKAELWPVSDKPFLSAVTHIQSLSEFYLHGNMEKLAALMTQLQKTASELPQAEDAVVGTCCVAKFEDEMWYRVRITSSDESSDICTVKFIDYGNTQEMPKQELRELPDFGRSPCSLAVPCCFKEFEEYIGQRESQEILSRIEFAKMEAELPYLPLYVTVHSHKCGVCVVTLMDQDDNDVLDKYKVQAPSPSRAQSKSTDRQAATPSVSQPPATLDSIPVTEVTATSFDVVCTCLDNLTEFFCQPKENSLQQALDMSDTLKTDLASIGPGKCDPVEGGVYGCLFQQEWYRCVVEEVRGKKVKIRYIDWGNAEERDGADLRPLQPDHLAVPITLMKCKLHGLTLVDDCEERRSMLQGYIQMLNEKIQVTTVSVDIKEKQGDLFILVLVLISEGDKRYNIVKDMVQLGLAKEEEEEEDEEEDEDERKMRELQKQMEELKLKKSRKK